MRRPPASTRKTTTRTSTHRRVAPVFDCWPEISRRVRAAKKIALFLDFDGTLVDFRSRPHLVKLTGRTRAALRKLAAHRSLRVMVVSGRRRASLSQFIKVPRVFLHGLYGWEHAEDLRLSRTIVGKISEARAALAGLPQQAPGIFIEEKGISLAVHFRDASAQSERRARAQLRKVLARFRPHLGIIRAGNVWELIANHVRGKGHAVRKLHQKLGATFLPIYVGDDLTDEPAFRALRKGITVLVGSRRPTEARFSLRDPGEVGKFLEQLERELPD
ncbi:MAG: trehalose-phosphatase [Candidatus Acidiferrales bacterium]